MTTEELRESLLAAPKNGYARITAEQKEEMNAYCKRYMDFMDVAKTEREATTWAIAEAEKNGFVPFVPGMEVKAGDKVIMGKYTGTNVKLDGEEYVIVRQSDILAIVED